MYRGRMQECILHLANQLCLPCGGCPADAEDPRVRLRFFNPGRLNYRQRDPYPSSGTCPLELCFNIRVDIIPTRMRDQDVKIVIKIRGWIIQQLIK